MKPNQRVILFKDHRYVLKGMLSDTIPESPVPILKDGETVGNFQGIELFLPTIGHQLPLVMVDLVSNAYVRLTYPRKNGATATLGTSMITAPSYRSVKGEFRLIPQVTRAEIYTDRLDGLRIVTFAEYDHDVGVEIDKLYPWSIGAEKYTVTIRTQLQFRNDLLLQQLLSGVDKFRLFSIASMYSSADLYDANLVRVSAPDTESFAIQLSDATSRDAYLFSSRKVVSSLEVSKRGVSRGRRNTPGSPDSPSIRATVVSSSIDMNSLVAQGYLHGSTDINDDSLSLWVEWADAPAILEKGSEMNWVVTYTAQAPEI